MSRGLCFAFYSRCWWWSLLGLWLTGQLAKESLQPIVNYKPSFQIGILLICIFFNFIFLGHFPTSITSTNKQFKSMTYSIMILKLTLLLYWPDHHSGELYWGNCWSSTKLILYLRKKVDFIPKKTGFYLFEKGTNWLWNLTLFIWCKLT